MEATKLTNKDDVENVGAATQVQLNQTSRQNADQEWNILRHSRTCILFLLILSGITAGALTFSFSNKLQEENFDLQVRTKLFVVGLCVSLHLWSRV